MSEAVEELSLAILLVGVAISLAILIKSGLKLMDIPPLVGYLALGFLLRLIDAQWQFLSLEAQEIFEFLAEVSIISLLFRVGLESDLSGLMRQLSKAISIWFGNVLLSAVLGFICAYWLLVVPAVLGKLIGAGVPALLTTNFQGATLIGVSMIPRAEISTIIMQKGLLLGDWAVPPQEFAAMAVVSAVTSTIAPIVLRSLLQRWPQKPETDST